MAKSNLLRPLQPGEDVERFQTVQTELQQVIAQVLALGNPNENTSNINARINNDQVGAIVEGFDFNMVEVEIQDDDLGDIDNRVISDAEFSMTMSSMNVDQRNLMNTITTKINTEIRHQEPPNDTMKLFVTGGAGSGKTFTLKAIVE